jgi:hypothetical protein
MRPTGHTGPKPTPPPPDYPRQNENHSEEGTKVAV